MQRSTLIAVSLMAGIVAAGFLRNTPTYASGVLEMQPTRMLVTDIEEGATRDVHFKLVNGTDEDVRVKVTASCGCSSPPRDFILVEAHAAADVPIRVDTKQAPGTSEIILTAISEDERLGARASMSVRPVPQVVLRDLELSIPTGSTEVETQASFVGNRVPESLDFEVSDASLSVGSKRRGERVWSIVIARTNRDRPFAGGFVRVLDRGREIGRIDVAAPNYPFGHLRMGVSAKELASGEREWWWLLDSDAVETVTGGGGARAETVAAGDATWLRWRYPAALAGSARRTKLVVAGTAHELEVVLR